MVVSAPQSQPQPISAEEEALKRNTDCIYFLASPLTCKKGSECEYRHSDVARVNPRDCYFWLHSNCLNPKCGFRHPPLDGLLGTQARTSTVPSAPVSQTVMAVAPHVPSASTKPGMPCIFFQKGYCLKGDWCPFLHIPNSVSNKPSLVPVSAPPADSANNKLALSGPPEKPIQQKLNPSEDVTKSVNEPAGAKSSFHLDPTPPRNESAISRRMASQTAGVTELHGCRNSTPISNGNPINLPVRLLDNLEPEHTNSKDNDEISREPSPGFDVLVDDDLRDSDYYPGDDRFRLSRDQEDRNEYDVGLSNDYSAIACADEKRYLVGYDSHDHRRGRYGYEQHQGPSERRLGGSHVEQGPYRRYNATDRVEELDLRHRLAKHKKPNGLRSVINHENIHDLDRGYQGPPREDQRENTISSRLRGRVCLPRRSPSPNNRHRGRLSPVSVNTSTHQGRICDGVRGRADEDFKNSRRNNRGPYMRDVATEDSIHFAAPKSLLELKNKKNVEIVRKSVADQQSLGKRKQMYQESEVNRSFKGPKTLEEILKRKRGGASEDLRSNNQGLDKGEIHEEGNDLASSNEVSKSIMSAQKGEGGDNKVDVSKAEEDDALDDGVDKDFEEEGYEPGEGEWEYEQVGGEDDDLYEGDNGEFADEEDEFAKKMGVVYS